MDTKNQPIVEVIEDLPMPSMNVNVPVKQEEESTTGNLVKDEQLLGMYGDIVSTIKEDKKSIDDAIAFFSNIVMNDGDATTSSKEAFVNLLKIKADQTDKLTKIADLMTRLKMRETSTFPKYLSQHNNVTVTNGGSRRSLLEALKKAKKEESQIE